MENGKKKPRRKYSLASDITEENPFSGREICLFICVYSICVLFLIVAYETLMPVFNNPTYPFYNHVHDYTAFVPRRPTIPK